MLFFIFPPDHDLPPNFDHFTKYLYFLNWCQLWVFLSKWVLSGLCRLLITSTLASTFELGAYFILVRHPDLRTPKKTDATLKNFVQVCWVVDGRNLPQIGAACQPQTTGYRKRFIPMVQHWRFPASFTFRLWCSPPQPMKRSFLVSNLCSNCCNISQNRWEAGFWESIWVVYLYWNVSNSLILFIVFWSPYLGA